jgi:TRAP-type transport system periplasmic protein
MGSDFRPKTRERIARYSHPGIARQFPRRKEVKKVFLTFLIVSVVVTFVMASGTAESGRGEADTFHLTYAQLEPPEHPQGVTQARFKQKIEELSGGQITVAIYPSGTLFTQEGEVTALMSGDLDMATLAFQDMGPYLPAANMFAAPYIFTSYEHMERVFGPDSDVAADFYAMVADACGYTPLAAMNQGSRTINTKWENPIMTPQDMEGMILRMPNAPAWIDAGRSMGGSVTPIAYSEVYTALQTGTVEAQDNPLPGTYAMKFYEVTKQISMTRHIIDVKLLVINNDVWNQMSSQQQAWMRSAAQYACDAGSQTTIDQESELLNYFEDYGMMITYPDIEAFQEYSYNYYVENGLIEEWDMDLYERVQALK